MYSVWTYEVQMLPLRVVIRCQISLRPQWKAGWDFSHSIDGAPPATLTEKKSVDANKTHDSHSLNVHRAACAQQQLRLLFNHPPSSHLNSSVSQEEEVWGGRRGSEQGCPVHWQGVRQLFSARGFELFVLQRGSGRGGPQGRARMMVLATKKKEVWNWGDRRRAKKDPSISCHSCQGELLLQKCWDNTRRTRFLLFFCCFCFFHLCRRKKCQQGKKLSPGFRY